MYSIETNQRKLTTYIKSSVLVWVADKISKNAYKAFGKKARMLLENVSRDSVISEQDYEFFTACCTYVPFDNIIQNGKIKSYIPRKLRSTSNRIISDDVTNYLVEFEGFPVPLGFIRDFFEDDYELDKEVKELYAKYLEAAANDFSRNSANAVITFDKDLETLRGSQSNIFPKKGATLKQRFGRFWMHVVNILKIVLPIAILLFVLYSPGKYQPSFMDSLGNLIENKFAFSIFTTSELVVLICKAIILLIDIIYIIAKTIGMLIFTILFICVKISVGFHTVVFNFYDRFARNSLFDYCKSLIEKLSLNPVIKKEYSKAPMKALPKNPVFAWFYRTFVTCRFAIYRWSHKVTKLYTYEKISGASRILKGKVWSKINIMSGKNKCISTILFFIILGALAVGVNSGKFNTFVEDTVTKIELSKENEETFSDNSVEFEIAER